MTKKAASLLCALAAAVSAADSPWLKANPDAPKGRIQEVRIPSSTYHRDRTAWVYTPPFFDRSRPEPYDLLIAFDGADYVGTIPVPTILDNLLHAGKIAPTVAILIEDGSGAERLGDLANRAQFASFMANEVVPWARQNWNVTKRADRTIVTGSSAGGLASAYVAFKHPELFGNVLAQSPAVWRGNEASNDPPYEWLTGQYRASPKLPVVFWIEVGAGETAKVLRGAGPVFIDANRRFRDVLAKKGYVVQYAEIEGAQHEPGHWRNQLADGVIWLCSRWNQ